MPKDDYDANPHSSRESTAGKVSDCPTRMIGPYKILDQIGEGGMGVVYLAQQENPIRRRVALKVIRIGMDSRQVVARFELERQTLALMNHPNIARVYDAGSTDEGLPYFVMELVQGVRITQYCDRHRLSTQERLRLFTKVCQGVHHAHQKGIIHRDIKPSNILVAIQDEKPIPKIIDFGVAKAIDRQLTEETLFTQQGHLIGTPAYMSPEQVEMTALDVDIRTDVYSLGVLLYELLVGEKPFDMRGLALFQIGYIIREKDPPTPSTRLDSLGETGREIARLRRTQVRSLRRQLQGDLDWITLKALEKDRTRRYSSASEFAADVERHLKNQPVLASPPTAAYRARKFVRRHRVGVAAVAAILLVLILGIVGTTVGLFRAEMARREAERQREAALREADNANALSGFLQTTLASADPASEGRAVKVVEILDTAASRVDQEFDGKPEIQASVRLALASSYVGLGLYQEAEGQLDQALADREEAFGSNHPATVAVIAEKARLCHYLGRLDESEKLFNQALETLVRELGKEHPDTLSTANNLANLLIQRSKLKQAEQLFLRLLSEGSYQQESFVMERNILQNNYGNLLQTLGRLEEAEKRYREALAGLIDLVGEEHPSTADTMSNLGTLLQQLDQLEESEALAVKSLEIRRKILGSEHPGTVLSVNNLASILQAGGKLDEAAPLYQEALDLNSRLLGEDHPETLNSMNNLAYLLEDLNQLEEAEGLYREVLEQRKRILGEQHVETLISMNNLAALLQRTGRYGPALDLISRTVSLARQALPESHYLTAIFVGRSGRILMQMERLNEAETLLLESYNVLRETLGENHQRSLAAGETLGEFYRAWGKPDLAKEYER